MDTKRDLIYLLNLFFGTEQPMMTTIMSIGAIRVSDSTTILARTAMLGYLASYRIRFCPAAPH